MDEDVCHLPLSLSFCCGVLIERIAWTAALLIFVFMHGQRRAMHAMEESCADRERKTQPAQAVKAVSFQVASAPRRTVAAHAAAAAGRPAQGVAHLVEHAAHGCLGWVRLRAVVEQKRRGEDTRKLKKI